MKTLVIPDIHDKTDQVQSILETEKNYNEVVFLGDWFDSLCQYPNILARKTALFLKSIIETDNFYFLIGNHDHQYMLDNDYVKCVYKR